MRTILLLLLALLLMAACADDSGGDGAAAPDDGAEADTEEAGDGETAEGDDLDQLVEAAQEEGEVTAYIAIQEETFIEWAEGFESEYGIPPASHRQPQNALWERWSQETRADQHIADFVIFNDPSLLVEADEQGWIAEYAPTTDEQYEDESKEPGKWYTLYRAAEPIIFNTNEVSEEEAEAIHSDGYHALEDPAWEGRLAVVAPHATDRVFATHYRLAEQQQDEFGWDFLETLAGHDPIFHQSGVSANEQIVAGESAVLLGGADTIASRPVAAGAPIQFAYPEVATGSPFYIAISENAPNPNAARLFMEWATSTDGLASIAEIGTALPARDDVPDSRTVVEQPWYEPPQEVDSDWPLDEEMFDARQEFLDRWAEVFGYTQ